MSTTLVVDGANVVGSRPDGWWKDRAGAARRLHEQLLVSDLDGLAPDVVLVLEGAARGGVPVGTDGKVHTVHAPRDGDSEIVRQAYAAAGTGATVLVVTADRQLSARVAGAGTVVRPSWLLDRL